MGVDRTGGNSDDFWIRYRVPFLEHFYKSHPDELLANQPNHPSAPADATQPPAGTDDTAAVQTTKEEAENKKVYDLLELVRTKRTGNRVKHINKCCVMVTNGPHRGKVCGGSVTIYGKSTGVFFKHCRRKARRGCDAHAAIVEVLNLESSRQVQLRTAAGCRFTHSLNRSRTIVTSRGWLRAVCQCE
mmetsp:Transcript_22402/g.48352  ORF Transcript_22402/g.48352 Transcript_22402/m.48352 type:complete len:187 (+) Transcript_22402:1-561(+)